MTRRAPNTSEHAARLVDPAAFEGGRFRSKTIAPGVRLILGKRRGASTTETQAIRFDAATFSPDSARAWLRSHDYNAIAFEPASNPTVPIALPAANPPSSPAVNPPGIIDQADGERMRAAIYACEVRANRASLAWDAVVAESTKHGATRDQVAHAIEHGPHGLRDTVRSLRDGAVELLDLVEQLPRKLSTGSNPAFSQLPVGTSAPYRIELTPGELRSLAAIGMNYDYALRLHLAIVERSDEQPREAGAVVWGLSQDGADRFASAYEAEGKVAAMAPRELARKVGELYDAIRARRPGTVNPLEQLDADLRRVEQSRARRWFGQLRADERADLGDALVLDSFDWRDWGFERRPSGAFLAEVDRLRMAWEAENPTRVFNPAGDGAFAVNPLDDVAEHAIERAHRRGRHAAVVELQGRRYLATVPASRMSATQARAELRAASRKSRARVVAWRPYKGNPADAPTASLHLREAAAHLDTAAGALASNPPRFVQIGTARQLDAVDGRRWSWKVREAWPVFVPEGAEQLAAGAGRIYIVRPTGASAPSDPPAPGTRASDTFREWHAFDPSEQYQLDVPAVAEFGPAVGSACGIIYRSDKYGDGVIDYDHTFKSGAEPSIAVVGTIDSPRAILLRGGAFRITRRGIVD
jgi:hypothetical protein